MRPFPTLALCAISLITPRANAGPCSPAQVARAIERAAGPAEVGSLMKLKLALSSAEARTIGDKMGGLGYSSAVRRALIESAPALAFYIADRDLRAQSLYRGIDEEQFDPEWWGDHGGRVFAAPTPSEPLQYAFAFVEEALAKRRQRHGLLLHLQVPATLVRYDNEFPHLRLQDIGTLKPFIARVGIAPYTQAVARAARDGRSDYLGSPKRIKRWHRGDAIEPLLTKD